MSAWSASGAPLVVGHRGGRGPGWPAENTMAAFGQAFVQGARAIELDVRTCAGGEVVVFHDESLARMTDGRDTRAVARVAWADLARVDVGGGARVPLLAEVLAWARSKGVAVNVEMKHEVPSRAALARATVGVVRSAGADVLLSSFDPLLLALAAAAERRIPRALLTHAGQGRLGDELQEAVRPPLVQAIHLERVQAGPHLADYVARGLRVGAWTVNDVDEAARLAGFGARSIITDQPGAVLVRLTRK